MAQCDNTGHEYKTMSVATIQEKAEIIKAAFVELASKFEAETGMHLHLSVHHKHGGEGSEIPTCTVSVPEVTK